ncbi:MAG: hypothetical protein HDT25_02935 [Ruminococcus sp.]|nr:hypothetical protein [Ruminococcus sp.]
MFKRFVSVFLCVITVFTLTSAVFIRSGGVTAEAASSFTLPYYYYQMSDEAQEFYLYLRKAVKECRSKIKLNVDFEVEEFGMAIELLAYHDPITFNIDDIEVLNETKNTVTLGFTYRHDKETYDKMVKAYDKATNKILSKFTDEMSTYSKIKTIHDEIINNAVYDLDAADNDSVYGALVGKKAKCDGYAKTFTYVCGKAGIRTVTVIGSDLTTNSKENGHMWNKVYYNKKWYNIDVTWDDPISEMKDNLQYDYFMVSDKALKNTHKEDNLSFKVPKATDDTRGYYVVNKKYAESNQDVEKLIKSGLKSAAKKGKTCFSIKFASKDVMKYARQYLKDSDKMYKVFKDVIDSTGKKLAVTYYSSFDENMLTLRVYIFYEDTKLEDYFIDTASVESDELEIFEYFGIS